MTNTISPTDWTFYADHTDAALDSIFERYVAQSLALHLAGSPALAAEAFDIAAAAYGAKLNRAL